MGLQSSVNSVIGSAETVVDTAATGLRDQEQEKRKAAEQRQKTLIDRQKEAMARVEAQRKAALEAKQRVTKTSDGRVFLGGGGDF